MIKKVLVIGWDGATWAYLDRLLLKGRLPNLAQLLQKGARATLRSTIPPYTNVAWPSLVTGLHPAKTGVYDGARARSGSYAAIPTNLTGFHGIPIWRWVNRFGRRSGVLNVPMTFPAQALDGYLITGFDSPHQSEAIAYPRGLLDKWTRAGHPYRILEEEVALMATQNPHQPRHNVGEFAQRWVELTRTLGKHVAWAWQVQPVDFMFVVFSATDSINHRTRDFESIADVYEAADAALGDMLAVVDNATLICLVSDHGSTPAYRYIALYRALADGGWLRFRPQVASRFWNKLPAPFGQYVSQLWMRMPDWLRYFVSQPLLSWENRLSVAYDNIDWRQTKVFARTALGPLYINLSGRYPSGTVEPEEYGALRAAVVEHLRHLRDEEGNELFDKVWLAEELYLNANPADDPPDLVVKPANATDHMIAGYPTDPLVRAIPDRGEYGTHTPNGILLLAGPGIQPDFHLGTVDITDVCPTLLSLMDLPLPMNIDGQVLQSVAQRPLNIQFADVEQEDTGSVGYSPSEEEELLGRLRDLGYL